MKVECFVAGETTASHVFTHYLHTLPRELVRPGLLVRYVYSDGVEDVSIVQGTHYDEVGPIHASVEKHTTSQGVPTYQVRVEGEDWALVKLTFDRLLTGEMEVGHPWREDPNLIPREDQERLRAIGYDIIASDHDDWPSLKSWITQIEEIFKSSWPSTQGSE